mmetsp:Transcript_1999/g.6023  ORF Transcript_1999/g.6023 Transcript_1999/m.6023 type:complete len:231 (+) Transcript_1999:557-1249(+)
MRFSSTTLWRRGPENWTVKPGVILPRAVLMSVVERHSRPSIFSHIARGEAANHFPWGVSLEATVYSRPSRVSACSASCAGALTSRRFAAATIGPHKTLLGTHALALPLPEREVAPAARFKFAADATPSWMRATVLSLMLTPAPTSSSRMALRFRAPVSKRFESRSEGLRSEDAGRVDSKSPRLLALSQVRKPAWSSLTNSAADIGCGASTISGRPSASIVLAHVASDETE